MTTLLYTIEEMADSNLTFAKVVANPSVYSWSQAYHAGKLFAVLSLETEDDLKEKDYLNVLGKEILDNLEQEFFALEKKDLESIKQAVLETSKKVADDVSCSFSVAAFIGNILYVYILGDGKITLKRDGKLGNLIESYDQTSTSLKFASGFLQDDDTIILQTKQFARAISSEVLTELLNTLTPSEAAENLAPLIHEKEESGASSIIINYKPEEKIEDPIQEEPEEIKEEHVTEEQPAPFYESNFSNSAKFTNSLRPLRSVFSKIKFPGTSSLNHPRKVILTVVVLIVIVFVASVAFALKNQQDTKVKAEFAQIYPAAEKKYEEGQGLMELNQILAKDSFTQAKNILEQGVNKLPKNSSEQKQVLSLLEKINSALGSSANLAKVSAKQVDLSKSAILSLETKQSGVSYAYDDKNIYMLSTDGIYSFDLDGANKKQIIKNSDIWQSGVSVFPYSGYLYVTDKKQGQIIKFIPTDTGYSNNNYFAQTQDFPKAVSMAIDNNIYVLSSDGSINKYFKGSSADFSLKGLDKDLSSPIKIYTTPDFDNIYVLDKGNGRIVVFDKSGNYKAAYSASIIKNAKDFDVLEKDKIIYILSSGKLYEIDLK